MNLLTSKQRYPPQKHPPKWLNVGQFCSFIVRTSGSGSSIGTPKGALVKGTLEKGTLVKGTCGPLTHRHLGWKHCTEENPFADPIRPPHSPLRWKSPRGQRPRSRPGAHRRAHFPGAWDTRLRPPDVPPRGGYGSGKDRHGAGPVTLWLLKRGCFDKQC